MQSSGNSRRTAPSVWPTAVLVVVAISAASLALGLTVVGPIIQRRLETPAPVLPAASTAQVLAAAPVKPQAEVKIKERVIPRPKPKPDPTTLTLPLSGLEPAAPTDGAGSFTGPAAAGASFESGKTGSGRRERGSIQADVSPAPDEPAEGATRSREAASDRSRRRVSPLEALPALGSTLPKGQSMGEEATTPSDGAKGSRGEGGSEAGEGPSSSDDKESRRGSRGYRVQVGRFMDRSDAERLKEELTSGGLSPQVVRSERDGVVMYRVQVGTFKQRENAARQMEKLKSQQYEPYLADDEP